MPELGSSKKKEKKVRVSTKEVVSAYSDEGRALQKRQKTIAHVLTIVVIVLALGLFIGAILLFRT
ncbi:MAG: hypothetical protein SPG64_05945 [Candidatus Enteromonas sp.]|nr:hypothetical protein [Candidatus Enteromonas sp.]